MGHFGTHPTDLSGCSTGESGTVVSRAPPARGRHIARDPGIVARLVRHILRGPRHEVASVRRQDHRSCDPRRSSSLCCCFPRYLPATSQHAGQHASIPWSPSATNEAGGSVTPAEGQGLRYSFVQSDSASTFPLLFEPL